MTDADSQALALPEGTPGVLLRLELDGVLLQAADDGAERMGRVLLFPPAGGAPLSVTFGWPPQAGTLRVALPRTPPGSELLLVPGGSGTEVGIRRIRVLTER
jgi:hypothetical protein